DRIAALVAEVGSVRVVGAALVAENFTGMKRVGNHRRSAILTSRAQVMKTFEVAALALPVANRKVYKLELRHITEIGNRKHGLENCLQAAVFALAGQFVHLQEAVVGTLLNLDQVRDLDSGRNFGKVETFAEGIFHRQKLPISGATEGRARTAECGARRCSQNRAAGVYVFKTVL